MKLRVFGKQTLSVLGVTVDEYKDWCKKNGKNDKKVSVRKDFIDRVLDGRIVKNSMTKKLINKHKVD